MNDLDAMLAGRELLIFDFDGTIADTSPIHARAFEDVLAPHEIAVDYPAIAGMRTEAAFVRCFAEAGRTLPQGLLPELIAQKRASARASMERGVEALPGIDGFLRFARTRWRMALVSSASRATVEPLLDKLGYLGWFDPTIFAEDVTEAKPAPEGFLKAASQAGVAPANCLVFEDSAAGFAAARTAGIDFVDAPAAIPAWSQATVAR